MFLRVSCPHEICMLSQRKETLKPSHIYASSWPEEATAPTKGSVEGVLKMASEWMDRGKAVQY